MPDDTSDDPRQIIADLQRQVAQYRTERDEALAQQAASAEVLQVINSSPGELAPVFEAVLERAVHLCELDFASLWTYDGSAFHPVARHRLPEPFWTFLQDHTPSSYARLVGGDRLVHIADIRQEGLYQTDFGRDLVRRGLDTVRSLLIVSLRREEVLLGVITAYREEVRPFNDKQITLLENFAAQAVIAMENARLISETRQALEQQTATAEVLGVINSSPGDLSPVFEAMLDKATRLCEASFGILWIFDGEFARAGALHQVPEAYAELCRAPFRPSPESGPARMMQGEASFAIGDLTAHPAYQAGDALVRAVVDLGGARSIAITPLRRDGVTLGAITIYQQELRPFTEKQIALLQNFAAQAVIAMENARLLGETREALEQQTATAEVLQVINSSPGDLAPVFDAMLEKTLRLCEAAHGNFLTYDGAVFHQAAFRGEPQFVEYGRQQGPLRPVEAGQLARVVQGGGTLHRIDAREGEAYRDDPGFRQNVDRLGIRTSLTVPLRKGDALLGAVRAYRREVRPFTDKQIALVENFAAQAVIAMENARLITETREALEQQTATSEVLQVINGSPGDLAPVFDAVLEKATRVCDAVFGTLLGYDGEHFRNVAVRNVPPAFAEFTKRGEVIAFGPGTAPIRLLAGEEFVHILDGQAEEAYRGADSVRALIDLGGARSWVSVALRKDDVLLGAITIFRQEVRPFTEKQIALLQNFAAQAVIAMENARLLGELRARTDEIAGWNRELEARVAAQLAELERTGRLKRFLAPQLAELIVAQGDESILESHRREIVVVFCDLRGFTGFAERAEPEEVMALLGDYHAAMGPIVASFEGTLDHYAGDGIMVFFNDPLPTPEPARRAIEMAMAMRKAATALLETWHRLGHDIGFGVGISQGYATLGQIGFAERMDYTAIGTVTNLAARLCAEAQDGQILINRRVATTAGDTVSLEEVGDLSLKGLSQAVAVYNVVQ